MYAWSRTFSTPLYRIIEKFRYIEGTVFYEFNRSFKWIYRAATRTSNGNTLYIKNSVYIYI